MVKCFKCGEVARTCVERETLAETERLLQLHSYETGDLIHQYYVERYREQEKMNDTPYGQLTIRGHFTADDLLEVYQTCKHFFVLQKNRKTKLKFMKFFIHTVGNSQCTKFGTDQQ